ncbi:hypothetical protein [Geodermatophilus pulveris]|nr:hypothetical protein [Geodermatophilus pulveris]
MADGKPAWLLSLVTGFPFEVLMTVLTGVQGDDWPRLRSPACLVARSSAR